MAKTAQKLSKKENAQFQAAYAQAHALLQQNQLQDAKDRCEQLLMADPENTDVLNLLGVIAYRGGQPNLAIGYYKRLLDADPTNAEALFNLGNLLFNLGYIEQAQGMYESVLTHAPTHLFALLQLGKLYRQQERWTELFSIARRVLNLEAWHDEVWEYANSALPHVPRDMLTPEYLAEVDALLRNPSNNALQAIMLASRTICYAYPAFNLYIDQINRGEQGLLQAFGVRELATIFDIPLLHTLLRHYTVPHASLEKAVTSVRQHLLEQAGDATLPEYFSLLLTVAMQSHVNEYVAYQTPQEQEAVDRLQAQLEAGPLQPDGLTVCRVLLYGAYRPLSSLGNAASLSGLAKKYKDKEFRRFIQTSVDEVLEERTLAGEIQTIGTIDDAISQAVQGQYEENPYPRWIDYGGFPAERMDVLLKRLFPHFDITLIAPSTTPEILVAGCGTGRHAVATAQRFAGSKITAVDLSRASLAYAIRKCREYGYKNIQYYQADILKLGALEKQFDIVESCGVLHHMHDPMQGWQVITDLLKPGGLMKIALYSAKAREDITAMRTEIKANGYGDSAQEIRRFRHDLLQSPTVTKDYAFAGSCDFYGLSECRDLLFHRQEHCTSIPEIRQRLEQLGLRFIGFEIVNHTLLREFAAQFPEDTHYASLDNWHALEQRLPKTFFGMYQFWCYKPV